MQLLLNSEDITTTIANVNDTNDNSSMVFFQRMTENSIQTSFSNGVGVVVSVSFGLLSFVATSPAEFEGQSRGLLGNFNQNAVDDLTYPNGTVLSINASDSEIHDFGQTCKFRHDQ